MAFFFILMHKYLSIIPKAAFLYEGVWHVRQVLQLRRCPRHLQEVWVRPNQVNLELWKSEI